MNTESNKDSKLPLLPRPIADKVDISSRADVIERVPPTRSCKTSGKAEIGIRMLRVARKSKKIAQPVKPAPSTRLVQIHMMLRAVKRNKVIHENNSKINSILTEL